MADTSQSAKPEPASTTPGAIPATTPGAISGAIAFGLLDQRLGYFLRRAQIAVFADFYRACAEHDIRPVQYSVLTIIENNPGLPQTSVADALGIKKANFVGVITTLARRGLVERRVQANDRRSYGLYLTAAAVTLLPVLHGLAEAHEQRIISRVGARAHAELFGLMKAIETL